MPHVDVGPHRLWVEDRGSGPPVLFVHGLFLDGRMFEAQVEALADRYRTLTVDVRDHGRSEGPPQRWTLGEAAGEIVRLVEELGLASVHWVGLSMGGMLGMRAALAHPERIRSLALLDTSADAEPRAWLHKAMARATGVVGRPAARLFMPYVVRQMFSPDGRSSEDARTWTERILAVDPDRLERGAMAVFERGSILHRLPEIDVPTLVLVGEEDQATPPREAEKIAQGIPDADLARVPDAGHLSPLERPDRVTEAIEGFLRETIAHEAEQVPDAP